MEPVSTDLVYLYGIVGADAPDPPAVLFGIDDRPVRLLRVGNLAAIVSDVSRETYEDDALNARLGDLAWVGVRGVIHENVLDWFGERVAVIPLSLFSLHLDDSRVERRIRADQDNLERLLARLSGRREWGVKLWRIDSEAAAGIDRISASLAALNRQIDESPPGRRYLLERKRETMRTEEVRAASKRIAHELYSKLGEQSSGAVSVPLPTGVAGADRTLLLHAAFLVANDSFERFQDVLNEEARRLAGSGFTMELTGPWPPYHFTDDDD